MALQVCLLPTALIEMAIAVHRSGKLTLADRYGLLAALLDESLPEIDRQQLNRLLYSLRRGRLEVEGCETRTIANSLHLAPEVRQGQPRLSTSSPSNSAQRESRLVAAHSTEPPLPLQP
jgi:hypothetical protein